MNPYQILGISPSASDDEVKKAYRTLSKKYHPDANIGNPHQAEYTEKFKEVQNAYKTIMDERKKGFRQQSYGHANAATMRENCRPVRFSRKKVSRVMASRKVRMYGMSAPVGPGDEIPAGG